ncbi:fused DSP-PTPase phosphatase/NAD kinase-like protein [Pectobacterium parvum]|uniref:phosphatase domain-containing protein n=1 Tax=Pectobacterium parvum TaxID=2778550 RepID=UPI0021C919EE|nr:hypothetical protein [Pectobacterium parvum]MCU1800693.1 hypothetical protein [Pectobacterium parvum]
MLIKSLIKYRKEELKYALLGFVFGIIAYISVNSFLVMVFTWFTIVMITLTVFYFFNSTKIFLKNVDGLSKIFSFLILLPFYIINIFYFKVQRLKSNQSREFQKVNNELYIGRLINYNRLPSVVESVIDLTVEFIPKPSTQDYYSIPILDDSYPSDENIRRFIDVIDKCHKPIFIHCAEGHGRTLLMAAIYLKKRGFNKSTDEAIADICKLRNRCKLSFRQERFLYRINGDI